jgi:predicted Zn-dependent protease
MMDFFASLGPNGRIFHEQASYLRNKMGKRVFSSKLTIWDDPFNAGTIPLAFDFEGYPKQKTLLVRAGVPKAIVYDSYLANKYKQRNTGHALPAPNTEGPIPGNLIITPGKKTSEQLIKGVKKGLLITRFWYVRMLHHYQMNITGMTRDGTFLIVNGKIVYGVKNLRFTQSIPEVLRNIVELSRESSIQLSWVGAGYYPFLFIKKFHFTSTTQF